MKIDQVKRSNELLRENGRLQKAVSDFTLDKLILMEVARGMYGPPRVRKCDFVFR